MNNLNGIQAMLSNYQNAFIGMHKTIAELSEKVKRLEASQGGAPVPPPVASQAPPVDVNKIVKDVTSSVTKDIEKIIDKKIAETFETMLTANPLPPLGGSLLETTDHEHLQMVPAVVEETSEPQVTKAKKVVKKAPKTK
jgi:hypothetical protein